MGIMPRKYQLVDSYDTSRTTLCSTVSEFQLYISNRKNDVSPANVEEGSAGKEMDSYLSL